MTSNEGNILMKEISWLTQALVDSGTVVYEKKPQTDLISQLQYKAIPASGAVQQIAEAPRETVFYQVDAPLLRDVIYQYTNEYNHFVTAAAQIPKKAGKKTKEKKTDRKRHTTKRYPVFKVQD